MAESLDIVIKATDLASGTLSTISGSVADLGSKAAGVAGKGFSGLQSAVGTGLKAAAGLGIGALVGLGAGMRSAIMAGSEAEEMMGKFNVVFANLTKAVVVTPLTEFANEVGRSKFELLEMASTFGDTLKPMGFTEKAAGDLAVDLTKLATDLGSFNNMDMDEALRRLQGTLIGSHENALAFGVVINENTLKAEMLANGWNTLTGKELEAAKVQARINLLMAGTTDAQGDAARTSQSWANQMRALKSTLSDAVTEIGLGLLPVITPMLGKFRELADYVIPILNTVIGEFSRGMEATGSIVGGVMEVLDNFLPEEMLNRIWNVVDAFGEFFQAAGDYGVFAGLMEVLDNFLPDEVIEQIWQLADSFSGLVEQISSKFNLSDIFIALGVVVASIIIPAIIGLIATIAPVILVFAAIVTAVMLLRKAWESNFLGIRDFVSEAMTKIQTIIRLVLDKVKALWAGNGAETSALVKGIWQYIQDAISFAMDTILTILDIAMAVLSGDWETAWAGVLSILAGVWDMIKSLWSNVLTNLWALIKNVDWGALGSSIIHGIAAGISAAAGAIGSALLGAVTSAWESAKNFLGIHSPSALFADMGRQTMLGMAQGISGSARLPAMAAVGAAAGTYSNAFHVTINATNTDPASIYAASRSGVLAGARAAGYR